MSEPGPSLLDIVEELNALLGGRVQRVDLIHPQILVLELRRPGRTVRVLVDARSGLGKIHQIGRRPPREQDGGARQRVFRHRLQKKFLTELKPQAKGVTLVFQDVAVVAHFDGRPHPLQLEDFSPAQAPVEASALAPWPERFVLSEQLAVAPTSADPLAGLKERARRVAMTRVRKLRRLAKNLNQDAQRMEAMAAGAATGELMKSALHTITRGDTEVVVTDWSSGEATEVTLSLNPRFTPQQNLQRLFDKAKKGARGLPQVKRRQAEVHAQLEALQLHIEGIDGWSREQLEAPLPVAAQKQGAVRQNPLDKIVRRFVSADGLDLWVGRSATANDKLLAVGRGHDIWLHARGLPGSHVLIRRARGQDVQPATLLDAAHLAAYYSKAKGEPLVDVMHTELRYVKKTKGAPAGQVGVSNSKTMRLSVEPDRLARLLGKT